MVTFLSVLGRLRTEAAAFTILAIASLASRLYPLSISPYPFNNDSMTEYSIVKDILDSGSISLHQDAVFLDHSSGIPVFDVLTAYVSSAIGASLLECGQLIIAVLSMLTLLSLYIVGKSICGDHVGGVTSAFLGIVFGTFAYTTGSVWKEALALGFMVLAVMAFIDRAKLANRVLLVMVLVLLPLTHHLIAVASLLTLALAVFWTWVVAVRGDGLKRRHFADAVTVSVPLAWTGVYYFLISFSALEVYYSDRLLLFSPLLFLALLAVVVVLLSRRNHFKMTFAPLVAGGLVAVLLLDYSGYLFPYSPSAPPEYYLLLVCATAVVTAVAWYGSEIIVEFVSSHRAIYLCLLLAPIAIIGAAVISGFSYSSHKVSYRVFDLLDVPLFVGVGAALLAVRKRNPRKYAALGIIIVVAATATFPFGFESEELLGVRHDTQPYEVDAILWMSDKNDTIRIVSDERIAYVSSALIGVWRDNDLPGLLVANKTLSPWTVYVVQDHWVSCGVNDYPRGLVTIPEENYTRVLMAANVFYIGGPEDGRLIAFTASGIGQFYAYGPFVWPPVEQ